MATKTKQDLANEVKELKAQLKAAAAKSQGGTKYDPGFHEDIKHDPNYEKAKRLRVLESSEGSLYHVMWIVKESKGKILLDMQVDLRFGRGGKPIPGVCGDREKWATLDEYFQTEDYRTDRAHMLKLMK